MERGKPLNRPHQIKEQTQSYENIHEPFHGPMIEERYEIINGIRYEMTPSPTVKHQQLIISILDAIRDTCRSNGVVLIAPMDVVLDEHNVFQPDVIFIANENRHIIKETCIEGAPDLVAEILSPSTSRKDKVLKKQQYERFGVKEYWVADPLHFTIDQFVLQDGRFTLRAVYGLGDTLTSDLFECIAINMNMLFSPLNPLAAL